MSSPAFNTAELAAVLEKDELAQLQGDETSGAPEALAQIARAMSELEEEHEKLGNAHRGDVAPTLEEVEVALELAVEETTEVSERRNTVSEELTPEQKLALMEQELADMESLLEGDK